MFLRTSVLTIATILILFLPETLPSTENKPERISPKSGTTILRQLSSGQEHLFTMALSRGEYAKLLLKQNGIDVAIHLMSPDHETISKFDSEYTTQGFETIEIVAEVSGNCLFKVVPVSKSATGKYEVGIVEIRASTEKDRSLDQARKHKWKSDESFREGKYEEARQLIEKAIDISEKLLGPDDPFTASLLFGLAEYYEKKQSFANAISLLQRALEINKKRLGTENSHVAEISRLLAFLYWQTNEPAKSETMANLAYELSQKTLKDDHYLVGQCLLTLAQITNDSQKREQLLLRALEISEKTAGPDNPPTAYVLNTLGVFYKDQGDLDQAEKLLQRSLTICKKSLGLNNINLVVVLHNLGLVAQERKDYALAEEYYLNTVKIVETAFGPENPRLLFTLNNLANIYRSKGEYSKSLETHLKVLQISELTKGPNHPMSMTSLGNIARTYAAQGNIAEAIRYQKRVDSVIAKNIELHLATGSEQEKVSFMNWVPERTDRTISLNVQLAPNDPQVASLAAVVLLQRKGRVLDAISQSYSSLRERASPEAQILFNQLNETTSQLANLVLNGPREMSSEQHLKRVSELEEQKEKLETTISHASSEFRSLLQPVSLRNIQDLIPENAALIEFAVYRPFDPKAQSNKEAYKDSRYIAYVLNKIGEITWHDLGDVQQADAAIQRFREALREPKRNDVKKIARSVHEMIMQPILPSLGNVTHLFISPDGTLNLIPFEALVDENNRYLVENFMFTYLTSGRDLLRLKVERNSKMPPMVFANPIFGEPAPTNLAQAELAKNQTAKGKNFIASDDLSEVYFVSLTGTAKEAQAIKRFFVQANVLTGMQATESAVKRVSAPQILHIATHGFFLSETNNQNKGERIINPLMRSGLALAGANLRSNENDDGILTALEASGLNLWGTKLVTLSACDTGLGEVKNGDGVYGLRRAFLLAGAETLVMSLWSVSDYVSRQIMSEYYAALKQGHGRGESLRQVQLRMLSKKNLEHPFYWASFIQLGEWSSL